MSIKIRMSKFAKIMVLNRIFKALAGKRYYLLMDGMHSCAYIPKNTYRYMNKLMLKSLDKDPKAENSLRFLWTHLNDGRFGLAVNPMNVEMTRTHGLTMDNKKRIIIPCPYIQHIYQAYGLEPEYCGRLYLKKINKKPGANNFLLVLFELVRM